ncbi:MAG: ABC transporter permease subunit, partial [Tenericutes bacterium]|nr:ABC transporter permease subunit [Mycoplasmatota bacterium]
MLRRELKVNIKSLILWISIVSLMLIVVYLIYPTLMQNENIKMIDELIDIFPEEIINMFNMDIVSISSVYGWIKTEGYMFICLFGSIYSSILGANILWKEERDKTIEFLISKPVTRKQIVTSKILCGIIYIFAFNFIIFVVNMIGLLLSSQMIWNEFLLFSFAPLIIYYIIFFLSLLLSVVIRNTKSMIGISLALVFISYLLQIIGSISSSVKILKQISFFEFVSIRYLIENLHINYIYLIIAIIIITISLFIIYIEYNKKELV